MEQIPASRGEPFGAPIVQTGKGIMGALRLLVVEDEPLIAMLLEEVIAAMGHDVCAVEATETAAVAAAARCRPDVLIVDAGLAEGNGISAVARILRTGFVPHVFISGERLPRQMLDARAVVLNKPFSESELSEAIEAAVAGTS